MTRFVLPCALGAVAALLIPVAISGSAAADDYWVQSESPWSEDSRVVADLAVGGSGTSALAVTRDSGTGAILARSAKVSGTKLTWTSSAELAALSGQSPQVAISADGAVGLAAWLSGSELRVRVADISDGSATWRGTSYSSVDLGNDPQGELALQLSRTGSSAYLVTAVWAPRITGGIRSVSGVLDSDGISWGATQSVTAAAGTRDPVLAASDDGSRVTAVWSESGAGGLVTNSASGTVGDDGSGYKALWGAVSTASQISSSAGATSIYVTANPRAAVSADGLTVAAVWEQDNISPIANSKIVAGVAAVSGSGAATTTVWNHDTIADTPTISDPAFTEAAEVDLTFSADGTRVDALWTMQADDSWIQGWTGTVAAGAISGSTMDLSEQTATVQHSPSLAVSRDGSTGTALWIGSDADEDALYALPLASGGWGWWESTRMLADAAVDPRVAGSDDGTRVAAAWNPIADPGSPSSAVAAGLIGVPAAPALTQVSDTLQLGSGGGSPAPASYQIAYSTQARVDAGKNWALWATRWPADQTSIDLGAMQGVAACDVVAATASPEPGRCARAIGEHGAGETMLYRVTGVSAAGRSAPTILSVVRPGTGPLSLPEPDPDSGLVPDPDSGTKSTAPQSATRESAGSIPWLPATRTTQPTRSQCRAGRIFAVRAWLSRRGWLRVRAVPGTGEPGKAERIKLRLQRNGDDGWRNRLVLHPTVGHTVSRPIRPGRWRIAAQHGACRTVSPVIRKAVPRKFGH